MKNLTSEKSNQVTSILFKEVTITAVIVVKESNHNALPPPPPPPPPSSSSQPQHQQPAAITKKRTGRELAIVNRHRAVTTKVQHHQQHQHQQYQLDGNGDASGKIVKKQKRVMGSESVVLPDEIDNCKGCKIKGNVVVKVKEFGGMGAFAEAGWISDGSLCSFSLPSGVQIYGAFKMERHCVCVWDFTTREVYKSPSDWMASIFSRMQLKGRLIPTDKRVEEQMGLTTECFRYVRVEDVGLTLYQLAFAYLHNFCVNGSGDTFGNNRRRFTKQELISLFENDAAERLLVETSTSLLNEHMVVLKEKLQEREKMVLMLSDVLLGHSDIQDVAASFSTFTYADAITKFMADAFQYRFNSQSPVHAYHQAQQHQQQQQQQQQQEHRDMLLEHHHLVEINNNHHQVNDNNQYQLVDIHLNLGDNDNDNLL